MSHWISLLANTPEWEHFDHPDTSETPHRGANPFCSRCKKQATANGSKICSQVLFSNKSSPWNLDARVIVTDIYNTFRPILVWQFRCPHFDIKPSTLEEKVKASLGAKLDDTTVLFFDPHTPGAPFVPTSLREEAEENKRILKGKIGKGGPA